MRSEEEVRALIVKTLGVKPADITSGVNQVEGTSVLNVHVASLHPGLGPAQIGYIFGHQSKKLIQVNVIWGEDSAKDQIDPNSMIAAGTRLARYFAGFNWRKDTTRSGVPLGPNTVVLFSGEDEKKGAVRLVVDNVKYQMQDKDNKETTSIGQLTSLWKRSNTAGRLTRCSACLELFANHPIDRASARTVQENANIDQQHDQRKLITALR